MGGFSIKFKNNTNDLQVVPFTKSVRVANPAI